MENTDPQHTNADRKHPDFELRDRLAMLLGFRLRSDKWQVAASNGSLLFADVIPGYSDSIDDEIEQCAQKGVDKVKNERVWYFTHAIEIVRGILIN